MMAHNLSAHILSSALINHRSSPYLGQDHMIPSRHIPVLSVPEILEAFHQAHPSSGSSTVNLCSNSLLRSIGSDTWELPELKWLDPADNSVVEPSSENLIEADKYTDHSLTSLVGPEKFTLDGGERWPFSALYAGDRVAANCASAAVDDSLAQFSLQSMVTTSPASSGSSVLIKNNCGISPLSTISNFVSRDFATSTSGSQPPEWRSNSNSNTGTASRSSGSKKRPAAPPDQPDSDPGQNKSNSDRPSFKVRADNCSPERLVSSSEVSALTASAPNPPGKRRKVQSSVVVAARDHGSSTPASSAAGPDQKISNEKGSVSGTTTNDQTVSPGRESSKKSAAAATTVSDHEIHIWTERERRKKMNGMFSTLHSLLPHLTSKADKSTIVDEAINYIQSLEVTMKGLLKRKRETSSSGEMPTSLALMQASQNAASAAATETDKISASTSTVSLRAEYVKPSAGRAKSAGSSGESQQFQTLCSPNVVLNICGMDAFITISSPRGRPGLLCRVLFVLEAHSLHVLNAHTSTTDDTVLHMLHAQSADTKQPLADNPDLLKLALQELTSCLDSGPMMSTRATIDHVLLAK